MADPVDDLLAAATSALRDEARPEDAPVEATRRRVMASVGEGRRTRRWRVGFVVFGFALSTATLSWAASTGRLDGVLERVGLKAPKRAASREGIARTTGPETIKMATPEPIATPDLNPNPIPNPIPNPNPTPNPTPNPIPNPIPNPTPIPNPNPAPKPHRVAAKVDDVADVAAYRRAHALHFRGGTPAETLAAWDAYLAAFPTGRFAAEARYNRAIVLVRLDRIDDARAALAPFAAGTIEHGYRQHEAIELRDALEDQP